ncbi:hypothetical protein ON010_g16815 [Phytophthora cinnamomi]|nr:hypothetical protein ON010_g16815 [Phytophthora cinnamomi]
MCDLSETSNGMPEPEPVYDDTDAASDGHQTSGAAGADSRGLPEPVLHSTGDTPVVNKVLVRFFELMWRKSEWMQLFAPKAHSAGSARRDPTPQGCGSGTQVHPSDASLVN